MAKPKQKRKKSGSEKVKAVERRYSLREGPSTLNLKTEVWRSVWQDMPSQEARRIYRQLDHTADGELLQSVDLEKCSEATVQVLIDWPVEDFPDGEREKFMEFANGPVPEMFDTSKEFYRAWVQYSRKFGEKTSPNCEIQLNGRWYPVHARADFYVSFFSGAYSSLACTAKIVDQDFEKIFYVTERTFLDPETGRAAPANLAKILERLGVRELQTDLAEFQSRVMRAEHIGEEPGRVVSVSKPVCVKRQVGWNEVWEPVPFGSPEAPRKAIVEHDLETKEDRRSRDDESTAVVWPFLRVFAIDRKKYVYIDVDDAPAYQYDEAVIDKLVVPPEYDNLLRRVFAGDTTDLVGDVVRGKHGGLLILASGPTGTGKTMSAEVYAEHTKRPLYVLTLADLGTDPSGIEASLDRVFIRAARWNALLLVDEADILMSERSDDDLERSAIVGVFLRMLDYYTGLMFLTSNRPEVLDNALKSRITIHLPYEGLTQQARHVAWTNLLRAAKMKVPTDLEVASSVVLNGRVIRNLVRLARIIHSSGECTGAELAELAKFSFK